MDGIRRVEMRERECVCVCERGREREGERLHTYNNNYNKDISGDENQQQIAYCIDRVG